MKQYLSFFALALLLTATGCSKNDEKKVETPAAKPADPATLQRGYTTLRDTLDGRWAQMMASDDEKIFFQKRLLEEISYVPGADEALMRRLNAANERLKPRRYTQMAMASDSIDSYDEAQDAVLLPLGELAGKYIGTAKRPVLAELLEAIQLNHDLIVRYRLNYDRAAREYNNFLRQYAKQLPPAAADAKLVPLFAISAT